MAHFALSESVNHNIIPQGEYYKAIIHHLSFFERLRENFLHHTSAPPPPTPTLMQNEKESNDSLQRPIKYVLVTAAVAAAAVATYRLFDRWQNNPNHAQFRHRTRLVEKFSVLSSSSRGASSSLLERLYQFVFAASPRNNSANLRKNNDSNPDNEPQPEASKSKKLVDQPASSDSLLSSLLALLPSSLKFPPSNQNADADEADSKTIKHANKTQAASPPPVSKVAQSPKERYMAFLARCARLASGGSSSPHIVVVDPQQFYLKLERLRDSNMRAMAQSHNGREGNLHIVASFDHTLTTIFQQHASSNNNNHNSAPSQPTGPPASQAPALTSQTLLASFLPTTYKMPFQLLLDQYSPLLDSPHVAEDAKCRYMVEYTKKSQALVCEQHLTRNQIHHQAHNAVHHGHVAFRKVLSDLIGSSPTAATQQGAHNNSKQASNHTALCSYYHIPFFIISPSIHDVLEELLWAHGIAVANSNKDLLSNQDKERALASSCYLLANRILWSAANNTRSGSEADAASSLTSSTLSFTPPNESLLLGSPASRKLAAHARSSVCLGFDSSLLVHPLNASYQRLVEQHHLREGVATKRNLLFITNSVQELEVLMQGVENRRLPPELALDPSTTPPPSLALSAPTNSLEASFVHVEPHLPSSSSLSASSSTSISSSSSSSSPARQKHKMPQFAPLPAAPRSGTFSLTSSPANDDLSSSFLHVSPPSYAANATMNTASAPLPPLEEIISVGFVPAAVANDPRSLEAYKRHFDMLIFDEDQGDFSEVQRIISYVCGQDVPE